MADPSKAEKLAAAKRMLKEFQQKNKVQQPSAVEPQNGNGEEFQNGHIRESVPESRDVPPAEFFDSYTPQVAPEPDKGESSFPVYSFYNPVERIRDSDATSTTSSPSEDETLKKIKNLETRLSVETTKKEELAKCLQDATERIKALEEAFRLNQLNKETPLGSSALEEEIKMNLKTIQILVSQKSNLQLELSSVQEENKSLKNKCEELSVRAKALRTQVAKLEQEIGETSEARQQHNSILKRLELNLSDSRCQAELHKEQVEIARGEIEALNREMEKCLVENADLKKTLEIKDSQLSMAEVKIAQSGGSGMPTLEDVDKFKALETECGNLKEELKVAQREKSDLNIQFQEFINTLNAQIQTINEEKETLLREKNEKIEREEMLIRQLGELEKQMTRERQVGPSLTTTNTTLTENVKRLELELSETESKLKTKTTECENLSAELESVIKRLAEAEDSLERLEVPDAKKLNEAMENDRVAASRAIEQNTLLKEQVAKLTAEISETVVRLNNEKLDLTEKLQHSEHVIKGLKFNLEKYKNHEEIMTENAVTQTQMVFFMDHTSQTNLDDIILPPDSEHVTSEAMQLLQMKLKKTMDKVANLSEEKHKLEHLVTQLQGETETICEYVTLYQNQRGLLLEKASERERQLAALSKEREELKVKLAQINSLLPKALPEEIQKNDETNEVDPTHQIKTLLSEIETSSLVQDNIFVPPTFHPCLVCSGKLITV